MKTKSVYIRECKRCNEMFETTSKRCSFCPDCFKGQLWKMIKLYPNVKVKIEVTS